MFVWVDQTYLITHTGEAAMFVVRQAWVHEMLKCNLYQEYIGNESAAQCDLHVYSATGFESTIGCFWCFCVF